MHTAKNCLGTPLVGMFDFSAEEDTLHELLVLNVQQMKDEC